MEVIQIMSEEKVTHESWESFQYPEKDSGESWKETQWDEEPDEEAEEEGIPDSEYDWDNRLDSEGWPCETCWNVRWKSWFIPNGGGDSSASMRCALRIPPEERKDCPDYEDIEAGSVKD